jgi:serine phosphatase RsbU (regulator of sigma subunit)
MPPRAMRSIAGSLSRALAGQIFAAVKEFVHGREQHDDMTAVVFRYGGPATREGD